MFKGFYNLTSGMATHQRNLNVVGNNMVNISTAGFKESRYIASTFDDVMYSRVGNEEKIYTEIGRQSYIRANSEIYVDYSQGIPEPTEIPLDFAIMGEGFFAIQQEGGDIVYTRAGSFSLDGEGYLCFPGTGRVLDPEGNPIQLPTDKLTADRKGNLSTENGDYLGTLGVYVFEDNQALERTPYGLFLGDGAQATDEMTILHKWVERSNVNMVKEMVKMITTQRALQSAAQMSQIYDEVIKRAVNDIGRL